MMRETPASRRERLNDLTGSKQALSFTIPERQTQQGPSVSVRDRNRTHALSQASTLLLEPAPADTSRSVSGILESKTRSLVGIITVHSMLSLCLLILENR